MRALDVRTLVEAAQNNGASRARAIFTVVLPNLRGAWSTPGCSPWPWSSASSPSPRSSATSPSRSGSSTATRPRDGPVTTAVSILSLVLTWVVLLALSATGRRKAASVPTA